MHRHVMVYPNQFVGLDVNPVPLSSYDPLTRLILKVKLNDGINEN